MRIVAALVLLIVAAAALVWLAWPLTGIQWAFLAAGLALETLIVWAYTLSPPTKPAG